MLVFADYVKKCFDNMFAAYGILCVSSNDYTVHYSNESVFIDIVYDQGRSFEVNLFFGRKGALNNGISFNIGELLRLKNVEDEEGYRGLQASTQNALNRAVERLADLFGKYGREILIGDCETLSQLGILREKECNQYAVEKKLEYVRQDIESAWRNKNYRKVVALYESMESEIMPLESKKLEYARKHIND